MHVCLTCIEFFGDSIYGGFGRTTRFLGRELQRRGATVSIVVPRRAPTHPDRYELEGMSVHQYRPDRPWQAIGVFKRLQADVYHSQDASLNTALARVAAPSAAHVVTFRDPMDSHDWRVESEYANESRLGWETYRRFIGNPFVTNAIRRADGLYCAAEFLIPKATRLYRLKHPPGFLPSPVLLPENVRKADHPTVCFVGRWDARKRVELFFELARRCPDVEFIAVGGARDAVRDRALRERNADIPNLRMTGVLDQFATSEWSETLGQSWILVNTSAREALPTTFIEALAHRCAILSFSDPDGFTTRYGRRAQEGLLEEGLRDLLRDDRWATLGELGRSHVERVFSIDAALDAHLGAYDEAIRKRPRPNQRRCVTAATGDPPEVSVVIPTRDRRALLERCVDSVLRQHGVSFELIVVDDASSDGTIEWLHAISDPRVSVVTIAKQPSVSSVRNRGLTEARGQFVMFLDDDDFLEPGALRTLSAALASHPIAVAAVGARRMWFTTENYSRRDSHPHFPRQRDIVDDLFADWSAVSGQNLYRTHLVREIGGYNPSIGRCQDRDLWFRLAGLGPVVLRPEVVMTYRVHPGQSKPLDIREQREKVARRAIEALPTARRTYALRLRRTIWLIDEAEDAFTTGRLSSGVVDVVRAIVNTPGIFASPLIGPYSVRRLGGRIARRFG